MTIADQALENEPELEGLDTDDDADIFPASGNRTVLTKAADPEIRGLYDRWKEGRLILQADFQRRFVWDMTKASRLIESALLTVPLPIVYLAEESDGRSSVIDGQQRLTSFFSFIDGKFPDGRVFRLTGLKVLSELTQKTFSDLDDQLQDGIRSYSIRTVTLLKASDSDLRFDIFGRLNTGAVPLNDMELRNCIYHGPYMSLLKAMSEEPEFTNLLGFKKPDPRMRDVELVLRFAAFFHQTYLNYKSPMKRFFNRDMEAYRKISDKDAEELQQAFKTALQLVKSVFGDNAFKRFYNGSATNPSGYWETKRFNASLYDVLMGVFCKLDKPRVYAAGVDRLREAFIELMSTNQDFIEAIELGTSDPSRVVTRFDLARQLVTEVLKPFVPQPRCFSKELKNELFNTDNTCALCKGTIQQIDDSAVDHIEQYWRGGKTIPENARLTHRYCNMARSKQD